MRENLEQQDTCDYDLPCTDFYFHPSPRKTELDTLRIQHLPVSLTHRHISRKTLYCTFSLTLLTTLTQQFRCSSISCSFTYPKNKKIDLKGWPFKHNL